MKTFMYSLLLLTAPLAASAQALKCEVGTTSVTIVENLPKPGQVTIYYDGSRCAGMYTAASAYQGHLVAETAEPRAVSCRVVLESELSYKEGKNHGWQKWYDEQGKLKQEEIYVDGQVVPRGN